MKKLIVLLFMTILAVTAISQATYEYKYNARESIFDMVRSDGLGERRASRAGLPSAHRRPPPVSFFGSNGDAGQA